MHTKFGDVDGLVDVIQNSRMNSLIQKWTNKLPDEPPVQGYQIVHDNTVMDATGRLRMQLPGGSFAISTNNEEISMIARFLDIENFEELNWDRNTYIQTFIASVSELILQFTCI